MNPDFVCLVFRSTLNEIQKRKLPLKLKRRKDINSTDFEVVARGKQLFQGLLTAINNKRRQGHFSKAFFTALALLRRTSFWPHLWSIFQLSTHIFTNYNLSHVGPLWAAFMYFLFTKNLPCNENKEHFFILLSHLAFNQFASMLYAIEKCHNQLWPVLLLAGLY